MIAIKHHVHRVGQHLKMHHKKYLFGSIFGGLMIKLMLVMLTGAGIFEVSVHVAHAAPNFDCTTATGATQSECQALVDLYTETNGDNRTHSSGWLVDANVCNWEGISCRAATEHSCQREDICEDNVFQILLDNNNLSGGIPSSFGNLIGLYYASMMQNQISSLPASIGNLHNLNAIYLNNNKLTSIPEEIGQLSGTLNCLYVANNQLTSLPDSIGNLDYLSMLVINNNQITSLPESIGNLYVFAIYANGNQLTTLPDSIGNLTYMKFLSIGQNNITSLPTSIGNLTSLETLYLNNNNLTTIPESIGNLTGLLRLYISNNQLASLPSSMSSLIGLQGADLTGNHLISIPASLIQLFKNTPALLSSLNLSDNPQLQGIDTVLLVTGTSNSSLLISGNQYIGYTGESWDGTFLPPESATGTKIALAGEEGLNGTTPILTIEAGSTTADLIPYTGTFTLSTYVAAGTSGQTFTLYRSNYNDGNTWEVNSPDTTCTLDSDKMCTFETNHLSLFTMGSSDFDCTTATGATQSECQALVDLYTETNGDNRTHSSGWLVDANVCNWEGISCRTATVNSCQWEGICEDNVFQILLDNNNLSGGIPSSFGNLIGLYYASMDGNKISSLPSTIGNLHNLNAIYLNNNKLTSIPEEIGQLSGTLNSLYISNNQLTGLPDSIGELGNLSMLVISNNQITSLPASIGNLYVFAIYANGNQLTTLPDSIGNLTYMKFLSIGQNNITSLPTSIGNLTSLETLYLNNNNLTTIPESIGNLTGLLRLYISNNQLASLPSSMSSLIGLQGADLTGNHLISIPASLIQLFKNTPALLSSLNLSDNPQLQGIDTVLLVTGTSNSSLLISGNQYIGYTGESWDGTFLPPESATGTKIALAGEEGLNGTTPILTIEAGSTTADLIPYTGTFTLSTYVAAGTSGQTFTLYRSNYNDGNTWEVNSPDTTCTLDSDKMCTFETNHLSLFTIGNTSFDCDTATGVSPTECEALAELYIATNGDNWTHKSGWLTNTNVCTWYGIGCYASGYYLQGVGTLGFADNNLSGAIPTSIGNLSNLSQLYLQTNYINSIPTSIGNLTRLNQIRLDDNVLTSLPSTIGNLTGLAILRLDFNGLTSLPSTIGNLSSLRELNVGVNLLTGVPSTIGNLRSLRLLDLGSNEITSLPSTIGNITGLIELNLGNNHITSLPTEIGNMTNLSKFDASHNQLTGVPASIGNLTNIGNLRLNNNYITSLPDTFSNLFRLYNFDLDDNRLNSLPASLIPLMQGNAGLYAQLSSISNSNPGFRGMLISEIASGGFNSSSLIVSGNQWVSATNAWDGIFLAPQLATGHKIAVAGEAGLNGVTPILTIEAGSTTTDLIPYTGTFTLSIYVASGTSGQTYTLLRSNYNDGNTWALNSPDATCTLDSGNMCTFETNHLSLFTIGNLSFDCDTATGADTGTCEALAELYIATDGANWVHTGGWLVNQNVCTWYGVGCYSGNVVSLSLQNNNLSGAIPESFGNITNLGLIYMQGDHITSLPVSLGNLTNLGGIDLTSNRLASLPTSLGNLTGLTTLYVPGNKITSLPSSIGNLTHLVQLYLDSNLLTSLPSTIGNMSSLVDLQVTDNQLTGFPAPLGNLTNLTKLFFGHNNITSLPSTLGGLSSLQYIEGEYNQLTTLPSSISGLTNIRSINLDNNLISTLPNSFAPLTHLESFNLDSNQVRYLPASLIPLMQASRLLKSQLTVLHNDDYLHGILISEIVTGGFHTSSLVVSGNEYVTASADWDGTFMPPQLATGHKIAVDGEAGLTNVNPILTIEAGSTTADLVPYTGTFTLSVYVATGTSGQTFTLYRSNYNDGASWTLNSPDTTCTLDSGNMCTFRTNHLSLFTFTTPAPSIVSSIVSFFGGGGGSSSLAKDVCLYDAKSKTNLPGANVQGIDYTSSYYDKDCGTSLVHGAADSSYSDESQQAYAYAYAMGITTKKTIDEADLGGSVLRKHMAKMIDQYATNILNMKPNTTKKCAFTDMENEDKEMKDFAIKACQMGIMGVNSDGTSNTTFDPNGIVTRAQFGTMLSRVLYGNKYNSTDSKYRYKAHLNALNGNGIMKDISKPAMLEQRGFVLLMLMRTATK